MIVGIDFDNTIVCYDQVFYNEAVERDLVAADSPRSKSSIRDILRKEGKEELWTQLQGYVYGPGIMHALAFEAVREFFVDCRRHNIRTCIVSHKTRRPYAGEAHDLRGFALSWLEKNEFFSLDTALTPSDVFFADTKEEKLAKIASLSCSHFIDDLPEFLGLAQFPDGVEKILFDPQNQYMEEKRFLILGSWAEALSLLTDMVVA